jgi:hypothetical protein
MVKKRHCPALQAGQPIRQNQNKIGPKTVAYIEEWLASKGRRLRRSDEDVAAIVCGFKVKRARCDREMN